MEKFPPLGSEFAPILEQVPPQDDEAQKFIEQVVHAANFEEKRKPVEAALRELLGKEVRVTDFKHLEGKKYEFLIEVGSDGEEERRVVEIAE